MEAPNVATKVCKQCGSAKTVDQFHTRVGRGGKQYLRPNCRKCYKQKSNPGAQARLKRYRAEGRMRACFVKIDAVRSDKKNGRDNDLDLDFVKQMLEQPCAYCGQSPKFRTLDRVDNKLGHLKSNVVTSCRRCNYVRKDMPYEAWLKFVPALREVVAQGLFGEWDGSPHTRARHGNS